jgi:Tfp pilus assembly protein PilO
MDLSALKEMDLDDIVDKLKSSGLLGDKKVLIKFGITFGAILVFLVIYYVFIVPVVEEQEAKIAQMHENQSKITEISANTGTLQNFIKKLEPEYQKNSKLFHSKKEVEDLYQNISKFATINGLTIINLKRNMPVPIHKGSKTKPDGSPAPPLYFKIPVEYTIQGTYLGYLKFRRALSKSSKVINFDAEASTVESGDTSGLVKSVGTISIVGLPDDYS